GDGDVVVSNTSATPLQGAAMPVAEYARIHSSLCFDERIYLSAAGERTAGLTPDVPTGSDRCLPELSPARQRRHLFDAHGYRANPWVGGKAARQRPARTLAPPLLSTSQTTSSEDAPHGFARHPRLVPLPLRQVPRDRPR